FREAGEKGSGAVMLVPPTPFPPPPGTDSERLFSFPVKRSGLRRTLLLVAAKLPLPGGRPMNAVLSAHPRPEQLAAFRQGTLAEEEFAEVESHIADCAGCCRGLKALPDDSFLRLVRTSFRA